MAFTEDGAQDCWYCLKSSKNRSVEVSRDSEGSHGWMAKAPLHIADVAALAKILDVRGYTLAKKINKDRWLSFPSSC